MWVALLTAVFGLILTPRIASPASSPQKRVLLLYDTRSDMSGNIVVDRTIRSVLNDEFKVNLDLRSEYLDAQDLGEQDYKALLDWLSHKHGGARFDVVIAVGSNALHFASTYGRDLFRGAQMVFWGRRDELKRWESDAPLTGVVAPDRYRSLKATIDFILKLQPDLRQLIIVSGASHDDLRWQAAAQGVPPTYKDKLAVSMITGATLEALDVRLSQLPPRTAIVFLSMSADGAGRRLSSSALTRLVHAASAPIYSNSAVSLGTGLGARSCAGNAGKDTADLVARAARRHQGDSCQEGRLRRQWTGTIAALANPGKSNPCRNGRASTEILLCGVVTDGLLLLSLCVCQAMLMRFVDSTRQPEARRKITERKQTASPIDYRCSERSDRAGGWKQEGCSGEPGVAPIRR
jgi:hypothetical protein